MGLMDLDSVGFAQVGKGVRIFDWVRITGPETISLGSNVIVDDFVYLQGGERLEIGDYVHIASFASITGGGTATVSSFSGIAAGARVFTGTDLADGSGLIGPAIPPEMRAMVRSETTIERHVFIGANAVVLPGVKVGEGAVAGAGAVVTGDLEPWTIYVGNPARPMRERPSERILELAARLAEPPAR
jgi:acetyltransferase-like isoleucine patch superfamily enzyme